MCYCIISIIFPGNFSLLTYEYSSLRFLIGLGINLCCLLSLICPLLLRDVCLFSVLFVTVWFYAFLFVEVNYREVLLIHQVISLGHESKTYCTNLIIFAFEMTVRI